MRTGPLIAATAVVAAGVALVAVPAADAARLDQFGVKTSRLYEQQPAAATDGGAEYFAWSQNARTRKNHFDAFLSRTGDPRVKLNTKGLGYIGGIDPPVVAYQQVVKGNSNLKLYDVDTHARSDPPAGVNTSNWEWEPSISGDWLLFARQTNSAQFVILRSLTTAAKVVLDQGRRFHHAGQVSGDYAVWTRCGKTACNVVRRQISTATDTVLAKPADRFQYGAAVTSTGIVYVARSSPKCGGSVKIPASSAPAMRPTGRSLPTSGRTVGTSGAPTRGRTTTRAWTSSTTASSAEATRPTSTACTTRTRVPS